MTILPATREQATEIAELIMLAMNHECCLNWAGPDHTLDDFRQVMRRLVGLDASQYSYRNCLVAMEGDRLMGILAAYDGADLHRLRQPFVDAAKEAFGQDYSHIDDETAPGELYLDSLAVKTEFRHRGVASALLQAAKQRARQSGIPRVGLLVDMGNPSAERLYRALGFEFVNETSWGGHPMRHLQWDCLQEE